MAAQRERQLEMATYLNDMQAKRARGEIACAECRRLRLKCDRKVPCGTCVRRACGSICPNGLLKIESRKTASGNPRTMLADLQQLHSKVSEMSRRIQTLEDALQLLQEQLHPGITHRLLQPNLRLIKSIVEPPSSSHSTPDRDDDKDDEVGPAFKEEELIDKFGSLAVTSEGATQYFGRSAETEIIFMSAFEKARQEDDADRGVIQALSDAFPFQRDLGLSLEDTLTVLKSHLPPYDRAWSLCEHYLETSSFYFRPLIRQDLAELIFQPIFSTTAHGPDLVGAVPHPHHLSLVFFILAVGSLSDLGLPPRNGQAEHYCQLGKAAMSLRSILDHPSFESVVAMGFMTMYLLMSERTRTMSPPHLRVTCLLAQNLGLHRDPARWDFPGRISDMRRRAFWEVNAFDQTHSTITSLPPFFNPQIVDCKPPSDKDEVVDADESKSMSYWAWKLHYFHEILELFNQLTTAANLPSHHKIMALDGKIRCDLLPSNLKTFINRHTPEDDTPSIYMQKLILRWIEPTGLILLHRAFFTQCVRDHPTDPEQSPYAASYKAAFDASINFLQIFKNASKAHLHLLVRFPHYWSLLYSAAVMVGTAIVRGPNQPFASAGLVDLADVVEVYERATETLSRARIAAPYLSTLLRKAQHAYLSYVATGRLSDSHDDEGEGLNASSIAPGNETQSLLHGSSVPFFDTTPPCHSLNPDCSLEEVAQISDLFQPSGSFDNSFDSRPFWLPNAISPSDNDGLGKILGLDRDPPHGQMDGSWDVFLRDLDLFSSDAPL